MRWQVFNIKIHQINLFSTFWRTLLVARRVVRGGPSLSLSLLLLSFTLSLSLTLSLLMSFSLSLTIILNSFSTCLCVARRVDCGEGWSIFVFVIFVFLIVFVSDFVFVDAFFIVFDQHSQFFYNTWVCCKACGEGWSEGGVGREFWWQYLHILMVIEGLASVLLFASTIRYFHQGVLVAVPAHQHEVFGKGNTFQKYHQVLPPGSYGGSTCTSS